MKIKFIIGEAGTAKTTSIIKIANEIKHDFIALAFTHSACNNMIEKGMPVNKVKTLHSYFRIMPDTTFINLPKHIPKFIIIDEFSLINVDLLENIFDKLNNFETTIILSGDILQLPPVQDYPNIRFDNINLTGECSLKDAKLIYHTLGRTILNSHYYIDSSKMLLTKNFRCGDSVISIMNEILNTGVIKDVRKTITGLPEDTVFIASTYKNLKMLYKQKTNHLNKTEKSIKTRIGFIEYDDKKKIYSNKKFNKNV